MTDVHLPISIVQSPSAYPSEYRRLLLNEPKFGTVFTDHMFTASWRDGRGWHDLQVGPREPFSIDPACAVLHYGQEIFEGMKAYRTAEGRIALFRPESNALRFADSAIRMAMPVLPKDIFTAAVAALVKVDRDWVPGGDGSLYLRPFMFASEAFLGVRPSALYVFCIIACPVGPYFKGGAKPIRLRVSDDVSRAAPGGTGAAKCGGNYAGSLIAQAEATRDGCDQVVFLDAIERRWVEELGGMNLFFVLADGTLVTPPLGGTILPGITRASIMEIAGDRGLVVQERRYSIDEWREDARSGLLVEAFACGTAAVVAGIGVVNSSVGNFVIGDGKIGPLTASLRDELIAIQRGVVPDRHGWLTPVC